MAGGISEWGSRVHWLVSKNITSPGQMGDDRGFKNVNGQLAHPSQTHLRVTSLEVMSGGTEEDRGMEGYMEGYSIYKAMAWIFY